MRRRLLGSDVRLRRSLSFPGRSWCRRSPRSRCHAGALTDNGGMSSSLEDGSESEEAPRLGAVRFSQSGLLETYDGKDWVAQRLVIEDQPPGLLRGEPTSAQPE